MLSKCCHGSFFKIEKMRNLKQETYESGTILFEDGISAFIFIVETLIISLKSVSYI